MNSSITVFVNEEKVSCADRMTVATLLISVMEMYRFRKSSRTGEPRGIFCGMGTCFDCLVTINGQMNVRACMTQVKEGMRIRTS